MAYRNKDSFSTVLLCLIAMMVSVQSTDRICVYSTGSSGVHVRSAPCITGTIISTAPEGEAFDLVRSVVGCDGAAWAQVPNGFIIQNYTEICGGNHNAWNR
jgi:hypothetical protein